MLCSFWRIWMLKYALLILLVLLMAGCSTAKTSNSNHGHIVDYYNSGGHPVPYRYFSLADGSEVVIVGYHDKAYTILIRKQNEEFKVIRGNDEIAELIADE